MSFSQLPKEKKSAGTWIEAIQNRWHSFEAGPLLEAILVILSWSLNFFFLFESSSKNMKNDTTFVRKRSGDHLGGAKMSKRAPRSAEFNSFIKCDRQKRFSQNERRRVDLQNLASDFSIFA